MPLPQKKVKFIGADGKSGIRTMRVIEKLSDLKGYEEEFPNNYKIVKNVFEKELRYGSKIIVNYQGGWQVQVMGVVEILK